MSRSRHTVPVCTSIEDIMSAKKLNVVWMSSKMSRHRSFDIIYSGLKCNCSVRVRGN